MSDTLTLFATCPRGLEALLAEELAGCGAQDIKPAPGGVGFAGDWRVAYCVNLRSRLATRVLWRQFEADYRNEQDVYDKVLAHPWPQRFDAGRSLMVKVTATRAPLKSLEFVTLRIKDAVCDRFRADAGMRPSVDTRTPDVRVHAYFEANRFSVYLDLSGEPLYKRGLRQEAGLAPLKENLAAGMLKLAGWKPGIALLDPMCGSGTILMEAAQMALNIAPGADRTFGFQKLKGFRLRLWEEMLEAARDEELPAKPQPIYGSELYGKNLKLAQVNVEAAGLARVIQLKQADVLDLSPPAESGILLTNPPYGVRLGDEAELAAFYPKLGDMLKQHFAGWQAHILSADTRLPKLIGLKPQRRTPLYNGALECRLYGFELVSGVLRRGPKEAASAPE